MRMVIFQGLKTIHLSFLLNKLVKMLFFNILVPFKSQIKEFLIKYTNIGNPEYGTIITESTEYFPAT